MTTPLMRQAVAAAAGSRPAWRRPVAASAAALVVGRQPARRSSSSASAPDVQRPGLAPKANSYINLGKFETMGGDVGRVATGISYLMDALRMQEEMYDAEPDAKRRGRKAISLAQALVKVGRQHHQQQDAATAISFYERALGYVNEFLDLHLPLREAEVAGFAEGEAPKEPTKLQKAVQYAQFELSEILSNTGVAQNDMGLHEEALASHQKAIVIRKEIVGKRHPFVAECLNNIGAAYTAKGVHQKAAEHYEMAFELLDEGGQLESPYGALALYNIGVARARTGHMREAIAAVKRSLYVGEQTMGHDHRQLDLVRATLQDLEGKPGGQKKDGTSAETDVTGDNAATETGPARS